MSLLWELLMEFDCSFHDCVRSLVSNNITFVFIAAAAYVCLVISYRSQSR